MSPHWNNSPKVQCRHVAPLRYILTSLFYYSLMLLLSRKATNTNYIVVGLTWPWIEPKICHTESRLAYCKSINFRCIQFSRFLPTGQIHGYLFSCFPYCEKAKKKCTFRSTRLLADDVLYWQDKIVLCITFVMWNLLTLFYLNSKLTYVHSL